MRGRCSTPFSEVPQRLSTMDAGCVCVAGAALGGPQCHLHGMAPPGEVRRSLATIEKCGRRLRLRGKRKTWSTSVSFCVTGAARGAPPERSAEVRRRLGTVNAGYVCVAGAPLGAPQSDFAWQAQHLEHLSFILRSRCSTRSTATEARGSPATIEYCGRRPRLRGRSNTWTASASFCMAGSTSREVRESPATIEYCGRRLRFAWQAHHLEHLSLILRGRRSTWST